jgi:hypothetical protein
MSVAIAVRLHKLFCPDTEWDSETDEVRSWYVEAAIAVDAAIRFGDKELLPPKAANTFKPKLK